MDTVIEDQVLCYEERGVQVGGIMKNNVYLRFLKAISNKARVNTLFFQRKFEFQKLWNQNSHSMLKAAFHYNIMMSVNGSFSDFKTGDREGCAIALKNLINSTSQEETPAATIFIDGVLQEDLDMDVFGQSLSVRKILTDYSVWETIQLGAKLGLVHGLKIKDCHVNDLYSKNEKIPELDDVTKFWGLWKPPQESAEKSGPSSTSDTSGGTSDTSANLPETSRSDGTRTTGHKGGKAVRETSSVQGEQCSTIGQGTCSYTAEDASPSAGETSFPPEKAVPKAVPYVMGQEEGSRGSIRLLSDNENSSQLKKVKK